MLQRTPPPSLLFVFFRSLAFVLAIALHTLLFLPSDTAAQKKLTVQDILLLVDIGYTEQQLLQHIEQSGMKGKFGLTPTQTLQLRQKGLSPRLLRLMGIGAPAVSAPKPVSFALLKSWLAQRKNEAWIQQQLTLRGVLHSDFSALQLLELNRDGLSIPTLQLIHKLKQKSLSPPTPVDPSPTILPSQTPAPPNPDQPSPTPAQPSPAPIDPSQPILPSQTPAPPMPSTNPPLPTSQRPLSDRERALQQREAKRAYPPSDGIYRSASGFFQFAVPSGWHVLEEISPTDIRPVVCFTPENTLYTGQLKQGICLFTEYISQSSPEIRMRNEAELAQVSISNLLASEDQLRQETPLRTEKLHALQTATTLIRGQDRTSAHPHKSRFFFFWSHGRKAFMILRVFSQPETFDAFDAQAKTILQSFQIQPPLQAYRAPRLATPQTKQQIIQSKIPATVSISAYGKDAEGRLIGGSGSGFVVTPDGYVITNHHVIFNSRIGRFFERFMVNWDRSTGRSATKARLIHAYRQGSLSEATQKHDFKTGRSRTFQRQHIDIALLKLEGDGPYPYTPLASIQTTTLGDNIVAMGFPTEGHSIGYMGTEDITATSGTISRLIRLTNRTVNEIQHTAKVAGGNSGGPLYHLETGAAVGINTWVGIFDKSLARPAMGLGYYYAIPIDLVWQHFPDYLAVPKSPLSAFQWYDLATYWYAQGYHEPAIRAFQRAAQQDPRLAAAYAGLAQFYLGESYKFQDDQQDKMLQKARQWADNGLRQDPDHSTLLELLASISLEKRDFSTATYLINKMIQQQPGYYSPYLLRARLLAAQSKYPQALEDANKAHQLTRGILSFGLSTRGQILFSAGRYFESIEAYRKAQRIAPNEVDLKISEYHGQIMLKQYETAVPSLESLKEKYPYHPFLHSILLQAYHATNDLDKGWNAYIQFLDSHAILGSTPDAYTIYVGGQCVDRGATGQLQKIKILFLLGTWGALLGSFSRNPLALTAGKRLAKVAYQSGLPGITFGVGQILLEQAQDEATRNQIRLYFNVSPRPISLQEWRILALSRPFPNDRFLLKLFVLTPSVLDQETYNFLVQRGISGIVTSIMRKLSIARMQKGLRSLAAPQVPTPPQPNPPQDQPPQGQPTPTHPPVPPTQPPPPKRVYRRPKRPNKLIILQRVRSFAIRRHVARNARLAFAALRNGDFSAWSHILDPSVPPAKSLVWFRLFSFILQKQGHDASLYDPPRIFWVHHPSLGRVVQIRYQLILTNKTDAGAWFFRRRQGQWRLVLP
ncbi:trypsin-like peptidase domain-containing protein [Myxococcota bacterium]|nr:trypsin-like peptidase domain-containing protein [Myxococcota bacterium]